MSIVIEGDLTDYRAVLRDGEPGWLWRCPGCGAWGSLDDDQWHGRVSVDHAADGCEGGYHETHDFAADLAANESRPVRRVVR